MIRRIQENNVSKMDVKRVEMGIVNFILKGLFDDSEKKEKNTILNLKRFSEDSRCREHYYMFKICGDVEDKPKEKYEEVICELTNRNLFKCLKLDE